MCLGTRSTSCWRELSSGCFLFVFYEANIGVSQFYQQLFERGFHHLYHASTGLESRWHCARELRDAAREVFRPGYRRLFFELALSVRCDCLWQCLSRMQCNGRWAVFNAACSIVHRSTFLRRRLRFQNGPSRLGPGSMVKTLASKVRWRRASFRPVDEGSFHRLVNSSGSVSRS